MNINEIPEGQSVRPSITPGILKSASAARVASPSQTGISSDRVDTSIFSKLMQRGARELQEYLNPRPEKIAAFASTLEDPVVMSDHVVQAVLGHMVGA